MIWVDDKTAILVDKSIINFNDDGSIYLLGGKGWRKNASRKYQYDNKEIAIKIWNEVNNLLIKQNESNRNKKNTF